LALAYQSTLLSSQRTTTHRKPAAYPGGPTPGALVQLYCLVLALSTGISRFVPVRSSTSNS
jgi:hypothetical protein